MPSHTDIRRVVVVVLDGLRPDAIGVYDLSNIRRLAFTGASTMRGRTVSPSLTWPAMTSLLCGVPPQTHGILADSVHWPRPKDKLAPLPKLLAGAGYPTSAFMGAIPTLYRAVGTRIAQGLGFAEARFTGSNATDVFMAARETLRRQHRGLVVLHWADADATGHEHGWMSPEYGDATRRLDQAMAELASTLALESDPQTLLIALADHGGGGVHPKNHEEEHPLNWTVPILLAGHSVRQCTLADASLVDVPATIAWALGLDVPLGYCGRILDEAFDRLLILQRSAVA